MVAEATFREAVSGILLRKALPSLTVARWIVAVSKADGAYINRHKMPIWVRGLYVDIQLESVAIDTPILKPSTTDTPKKSWWLNL